MIESAAFTLNTRSVEITFLSLFLFPFLLLGQRTQPYFHNFTTKDGLPSSETYCAVQDREGYMWIGTDNGVARFDGYEFEVFGPEDGLEDGVVFDIVEDSEGTLWFMTFSGKLYWMEGEKFKPFRHNQQLIAIKRKTKKVLSLLDVTANGHIIIKAENSSMWRIQNDGKTEILNNNTHFDIYLYSTLKTQHSILSKPAGKRLDEFTKKHFYVYEQQAWRDIGSINADELTLEFKLKTYSKVVTALNRENNDFLAYIYGNLIYKKGTETFIKNHFFKKKINYISPHHSKGFWLAMGNALGLYHCYINKNTIVTDIMLEGLTINEISYDRHGGLWVCTQGQGVLYSVNPDINNYTDQLTSFPLAIQMIEKGHYLASYNDVRVIEHIIPTNDKKVFDKISYLFQSSNIMLHDSTTHTTFLNQGFLKHDHQKTLFKAYERTSSITSYVSYLKKQSARERYYGCMIDNDAAYLVDFRDRIKSKQLIYQAQSDMMSPISCGRDHTGRLLVGTQHGLFEAINDSTLIKIHPETPELNYRISGIFELDASGTLITTRGGGVVFLLSDSIITLSKKEGLPSNQIHGFHQTPDRSIWVNTLNGLGQIKLNKGNGIKQVRSYTTQHGLPSNEVNYLSSYGNDLWLATRAGVVNFTVPPLDTISPPPLVRSVYIDNELQRENPKISSGQHDLKITFNTISYQMLGDINYRYRIKPNEKWQYTKNRTVEYPNLNAGQYRFEVQSQNRDGVWSESKILTFSIPPLWHQTWWATVLGIIGLIGLIAGIFYIREVRRRKEQALKEQLESLERSAIQAQMNPHFVFNSLNSIQYFILENNTKQAVYYLARFASLIRQTLRASIRGVHTLRDEIDMLKIYLSLEKLRFKEIFEYQVIVSDQLAIDDLLVRPMLVQPFVENAILHGVSSLDAGGQITLKFSGNNQKIVVEVIDNGKGFDPEKINHQDSMGLNITRNRLAKDHPVSHNGTESLIIESILNSRGEVAGTKIQLILMPQSPKTQMHV